MKTDTWLWLGITSIVIVAGVVLTIRLADQTEAENRKDIDNWVDEMVAKALEQKLNEPIEAILGIFRGSENAELVTRIRDTVRSVTLTFTRQSSASDVQVCLNLSYDDGTSFSAITKRDWDRLPGTIREQFLRTGSQVARLPWNFPWVNPHTA